MNILPPFIAKNDPDRSTWCEFALQAEFLMLAQKAKTLGWGEREIAAALISLAEGNMQSVIANDGLVPEDAAAEVI